jgi:uncharacterized protein YggT (Ycf19 family)
MIILNSLNLLSLRSFLIANITVDIKYIICIFLINLISYIYVIVKFYKVLCYSKVTFEWLPMINPYTWPFSFFQILTNPYFALWAKILPIIKLGRSSVDVSSIIALEALNAVLYLCARFFNQIIIILENLEKIK